ncbi:hypothetical protein NADFUDRAFT_48366 [Nadsonia fulvescens var. elongata DSM 6958]|uniref:Uncharacterized protein n=1 Tax=Nadsonia fulvescens var. elongata DSM 6958 TaxID=857566 RepID=A0A1E3PQK0_9ASCO|nr:hypothetical protein NADFUDRAFT_48366 [Nadsonia fulvescens var. elongata DSM 6958]
MNQVLILPEVFETFYDRALVQFANLKIMLLNFCLGPQVNSDTRYHPGLVDPYACINEKIHQTWMISYVAMIMIMYPHSALATRQLPRRPTCINNKFEDNTKNDDSFNDYDR